MAIITHLTQYDYVAPDVYGNTVESIRDDMTRRELIEAVWESWPVAYRRGGGQRLEWLSGTSYRWADNGKSVTCFTSDGLGQTVNLLTLTKGELRHLYQLIQDATLKALLRDLV